MRMLSRAGYQAVSIDDFAAWWREKKVLPDNAFVLTFDDGYAGVHDFAAPILKALQWPAAVFLVAGKLGGRNDWENTAEPISTHALMDVAQLRSLSEQGFSLHSHSLKHDDLTTLEASVLEHDLRESRALISKIVAHESIYLAYPYGRHNETVRNAARRAGYALAFSVESGFNRPGEDGYRLRRLDVFGTDSPSMLLRKIRLGTNDGSLGHLVRYYFRRSLRFE
jgi:peptidoglycan/xylan/chitin deacetylase (PgdA/CDA1 family)